MDVTFRYPLLLGVVLKFENCLRNYPMHIAILNLLWRLTIKLDIDEHGQKQQILVKTDLILHVLNL